MSQPLYKISNEYMSAYSALYGNQDLPEQAIKDTLEGMQGELKDKVVSIAAMIKNIEADADKIKDAELTMKERRESLLNKGERMREYVLQNMNACALDKIFTPEFDIKIQACPPAVDIALTATVPDEFMRIIPEKKEPDKLKLKDMLAQGLEIKGISLIRRNKLVIS